MSPSRRRLILALLILGAMLSYADRQIIALLKPLIGADLQWDDAQYGHLASGFQLASAVGLLFAGWLVDRIGVRWSNPIAVAAWSALSMAQALVRTFLQFAALRIGLGAAEALGTPVIVKSIAALFAPSQRALAFGGMNASTTAGAILTPLFVPALATLLGWRSAFLLVGAVGVLWVVAWMFAARGAAELGGPGSVGAASVVAAPVARVPWAVLLRDRRTWAIAGAKALSDQVWWFLLFWGPDLLQRLYHLDIAATAVPVAVIYGCAACGAILGGLGARFLLRRGIELIRARKLALLGCALLATPVVLFPQLHREWSAVFLLGLTLAAHQGFSVNLFALIADVVPGERLATVTGVGAFAGNLGGMGILSFTGWVLTREGNYGPVFLIAGASYLLALGWIQVWLPVPSPSRARISVGGPVNRVEG
jgi:ACS family hexuronate transporter-like MFS transporter